MTFAILVLWSFEIITNFVSGNPQFGCNLNFFGNDLAELLQL